jgi:hypothetical protein
MRPRTHTHSLITGMFLVREKEEQQKETFALTMALNGGFMHHLLSRAPDGSFLVNNKPLFPGLFVLADLIKAMRSPACVC